jgi:hypothetical protein
VVITDLRLEKVFSLAGPLQASGALDVFNLMNANAEERISWPVPPAFVELRQTSPHTLSQFEKAG